MDFPIFKNLTVTDKVTGEQVEMGREELVERTLKAVAELRKLFINPDEIFNPNDLFSSRSITWVSTIITEDIKPIEVKPEPKETTAEDH